MTLDELFLSVRIPLLGMITPNTRAIAIQWNDKENELLLRYYFASLPSENEKEMVSDTLGEIVSHFWSEIKVANYECIDSLESFRSLDSLSGWLYMRKEPA
jgi:hypothetical protein